MVRSKRRASRNALDKITIAMSSNDGIEVDESYEPEYYPSDDNNHDDQTFVGNDSNDEKDAKRKNFPYNIADSITNTEEEVRCCEIKLSKKLRRIEQSKQSICNTVTWTSKQRREFITALKKIFKNKKRWLSEEPPSDEIIEEIAKLVSGRTKEEVKKYLGVYQRKVILNSRKNCTPVDKWFETCRAITPDNDILEQQLGKAVEVAGITLAKEDTSSSNTDTNKTPRYWMLYRYIACAMSNQPLPELTPVESLVIEECMQSLVQQVLSINNNDMRNSLKRIYLHAARNREHDQEIDVDEIESNLLHNANIYNPLGINPDSIVLIMPNEH